MRYECLVNYVFITEKVSQKATKWQSFRIAVKLSFCCSELQNMSYALFFLPHKVQEEYAVWKITALLGLPTLDLVGNTIGHHPGESLMTHLSMLSSEEHQKIVTDYLCSVKVTELTLTAEIRQGPCLSFYIPGKTQISHSHPKFHKEMEWNKKIHGTNFGILFKVHVNPQYIKVLGITIIVHNFRGSHKLMLC